MQGDVDVIDELTMDHRLVDGLFVQFHDAPVGSADRRRLVDALIKNLARHTAFEEQHLCPVMREHLDQGEELAAKAGASHGRVQHLLAQLREREPGEAGFDELVGRLRLEVLAHVDEEENNLFPQLRDGVHPYVLINLGSKLREARNAEDRSSPAHTPRAPGSGGAPGARAMDTDRFNDRP
ncbi:hemerythrin domain-containing protein [Streptomyces sp. BHT-5-2]|nr:hemerythrin domain-containing protein [Streptomyces sp. BHT-5-2]